MVPRERKDHNRAHRALTDGVRAFIAKCLEEDLEAYSRKQLNIPTSRHQESGVLEIVNLV